MIKSLGKGIASVFFVCVIIEIFLQLAGDRLPSRLNSFYLPSKLNYQKGQKVVLCLGDSLTAWGMEKSYPSYLQNWLDKKASGQFFVINGARLGETSASMIESFKDNLELVKPDFVVSMIGLNDYKLSDAGESVPRLRIISVAEHLTRVAFNTIKGTFKESRKNEFQIPEVSETFRPVNAVTWSEITKQITEFLGDRTSVQKYQAVLDYLLTDGALVSQEAYRLSVSLGTESLEKWPQDQISADIRAIAAASLPDFPQAEEFLEYAYKLGTHHPLVYIYYAKQLKKAGKRSEGLDVARYYLANDPEVIEKNRQILEKIFPELKEVPGAESKKSPEQWTAIHYQKLHSLLKEHQIFLVLLPYPMRNLNETKTLLSGEPGVEFVSYNDFFENSKINYSDYFIDRSAVDFGHLASKSTEFIAQKAGDVILRVAAASEQQRAGK